MMSRRYIRLFLIFVSIIIYLSICCVQSNIYFGLIKHSFVEDQSASCFKSSLSLGWIFLSNLFVNWYLSFQITFRLRHFNEGQNHRCTSKQNTVKESICTYFCENIVILQQASSKLCEYKYAVNFSILNLEITRERNDE
jgi:hypothetical protein